jgi:trk system potassium uptake protein TrkA
VGVAGRGWRFGEAIMKIVVVGSGKVGSRLAMELVEEGHEVTIIARTTESLHRLPESFAGRIVVGLGMNRYVLEEAGIREAEALAAVTEDDSLNIAAAKVAKEQFGVPRVVSRIYDPELAAFYMEQGIATICPTRMVVGRAKESLFASGAPAKPDAQGVC